MINRNLFGTVATFATASLIAGSVVAQGGGQNLEAILEGAEIPVTVDNFVRAATDIEFGKYIAIMGGVNQLIHFREPTLIDEQPTIRMNRDVLYSSAVIDISEGATLTIPEMGERYVSAQIVNQDHYMNDVFQGGGSYTLDIDGFETPYVVVIIRTLVDASDPNDLAAVHALQDQMKLEAASSNPFIVPNYDDAGFEQVLAAAKELYRFAPDSADMFGPKEEVDPIRYFLGAAGGWGGLPETEAYYLNVDPGLPVGEYKIDVPADVPVNAYWSISLYNADGFFEENALGAYNVNSVSGEPNDDGSMTVHFGGCDEGRVNCLPIMDGWNYNVRFYRPGKEVLDGSWEFPAVEPIK